MIQYVFILFVVDAMEEELFKTKERIIEISISNDNLLDANYSLEIQLHQWRKKFRKLQKLYDCLQKLHSKCQNRILYR